MKPNQEFIDWAIAYDKKLFKQLSSVSLYQQYHFYSDEGGILGNPRFIISEKEVEYFTYIGFIFAIDIRKYIFGRMVTWMLLNEDYSEKITITINP